MSDVYIVIVNYTKYKDTIECLESVFKSSYQDFKVILVDNSPDDASEINIIKWLNGKADDVETQFPELVYPLINKPIVYRYTKEQQINELPTLTNESLLFVKAGNRGFAAANNLAFTYILKHATQSSFIWVLNNDTVVAKDCLKNLTDFYAKGDLKKILGSKLMFYYKKHVLQAVAGRYNSLLGSTYHVGEGEIDNGQYDNYQMDDDNYVVGASMFLPFAYLASVGFMNEDYFLYYEELDWILRGRNYGFNCALQPNAIVHHKEGSSIIGIKDGTKKNTDLAEFYSIVNRVKITKKWFKACLPTVLIGVLFALTKRVFTRKIKLAHKAGYEVFKLLFTFN